VFDITVSGGDLANLNGTVTLGFAAGQNIQDTFGNALTNISPTGTNNNSYVVINAADMSVDLSGLPTTATVGTSYSGTIKCANSAAATASATSATCTVSGLPAGLTLGACSPAPPHSGGRRLDLLSSDRNSHIGGIFNCDRHYWSQQRLHNG
jgi:hypothetical protein